MVESDKKDQKKIKKYKGASPQEPRGLHPSSSAYFCSLLHFFLFERAFTTYEDYAAANAVAAIGRNHLPQELKQDYPMAFTPSKDQKRRDREQKKLDKRLAKEEAKAEKLAAEQRAEQEAEAALVKDPSEMTEEELKAKEEADFEAELAAEEAARLDS